MSEVKISLAVKGLIWRFNNLTEKITHMTKIQVTMVKKLHSKQISLQAPFKFGELIYSSKTPGE